MGGLLSPLNAAWLSVGCMAVAILFTALFLPESLSPAARRMVRPAPPGFSPSLQMARVQPRSMHRRAAKPAPLGVIAALCASVER